jgi:hypothetical protein
MKHQYRVLFGALGGLVLAAFCVLYFSRSTHCVLYYHGASAGEVPQGTAIAFLSPLRNRKDEANAEWLIRDLRTGKCEEISREWLVSDPTVICRVMRSNTRASLVWLDPESDTIKGGIRKLIYDLPDNKARLIVYFGVDEAGWGGKTFSLVQ